MPRGARRATFAGSRTCSSAAVSVIPGRAGSAWCATGALAVRAAAADVLPRAHGWAGLATSWIIAYTAGVALARCAIVTRTRRADRIACGSATYS